MRFCNRVSKLALISLEFANPSRAYDLFRKSSIFRLSHCLAMSFPEQIQTERLTLRWPEQSDAADMFTRYTTDPSVCLYMS